MDHIVNPLVVHNTAIAIDAALWRHRDIGPRLREPGKGREGGYFVLMDRPLGLVQLGTVLGACPPERLGKRIEIATEKATRLRGHLDAGHVLSRESRDVHAEKYAGAIAGMRFIYSFSGNPEDVDELRVAATACRVGDISWLDAKRIFATHPNEYFDPEDDFTKELFFARG